MLNTHTKTGEFKFDSIHYAKALFELMKPRVMSLAIFTCVVGFLIARLKVLIIYMQYYQLLQLLLDLVLLAH